MTGAIRSYHSLILNTVVPLLLCAITGDLVAAAVIVSLSMRQRIEQEAKKNQRSLNGEIVYRLGLTFGAEGVALARQFEEHEKEMAKVLREVVERIVAERRAK